jgi:signal peptidase
MNPTLSAQDLLEIKPYCGKKPKPGDVILFRVPQKDYHVVHRIIRICSWGIQTRGDNNNHTDPWFLKPGDVYGQIITAHRGKASRKITRGFMGRLIGLFCQLRRNSLSLLIKSLSPVYQAFCSGRHLHRLIPVRIQPRVASFKRGTNACHKLLLGNRIIGSFDEFHLQWRIKRPYRIFIDESSLPTPR